MLLMISDGHNSESYRVIRADGRAFDVIDEKLLEYLQATTKIGLFFTSGMKQEAEPTKSQEEGG